MQQVVLVGVLVVPLLVVAVALSAISATLTDFLGRYERPPLKPGDRILVRSFGVEQVCFVVDVGADGTVLVAPVAG